MAYFSQEDKAKVTPLIKAIFKKYGVKGSIAVDNHTSLVVNIKSGKLDFLGADQKIQQKHFEQTRRDQVYERDYIQVNPYHVSDWHQEIGETKIAKFFEELNVAMRAAGYYNNSDAMTDYFDTAYYMNINVGRWNKPYILEA